MTRRKVVLNPVFKEQLEFDDIKNALDGQQRADISKGNTGRFFCELYVGVFGGRAAKYSHADVGIDLENDDPENFRPDVIRDNKHEKVYTEVKSVSTKTSQPLCALNQLADYAYYIIKDSSAMKKPVYGEYAFFRYKQRRNVRLSKLGNNELASQLSERTKNLLVLPLNLAILAFLNSPVIKVDQTRNIHLSNLRYAGSEDKLFWQVPGRLLQGFHDDPLGGPRKLIEQTTLVDSKNDKGLVNLLALDQIDFERYDVDWVYCGSHKISRFLVTRFYNRHPHLFMETFRQEHKRILTEILKVKDFYSERHETPQDSDDAVPF